MDLKKLIDALDEPKVLGCLTGIDISDIASDSRKVAAGSLFIAKKAPGQDAAGYIKKAIKAGSRAVVLDDETLSSLASLRTEEVPFIVVKDPDAAEEKIADAFFSQPCSRLEFIGITGTNGKTSISYLVKSVLEASGKPSGLIGTIGFRDREENTPLKNTTPGVLELRSIFRRMADVKDRYVVMEVSSHALRQQRVRGISFCAAIFTNLTQDHLDYHKDLEDYFDAKSLLFTRYLSEDGFSILNIDDPYALRLTSLKRGKPITYGLSPKADVRAVKYDSGVHGSVISIDAKGRAFEVKSELIGKHNIYNILAAVSLGVCLGIDTEKIRFGIESMRRVPGRLEKVSPEGNPFQAFVDYAHSDDALKNVLESLRSIVDNGRIITVFGCGGDRDRGKRPKMGRVASILSDFCLITSDNPRSEDPSVIISQIVSGIEKKNYEVEPDRSKAIHKALGMASSGDIVLIAGKGHETSQTIGDKVFPFDDREVARQYFADNK